MHKVADLKDKRALKVDIATVSGSVEPKTVSDASTIRIRELLEHCDALEREIQINAEKYKAEIARLKQLANNHKHHEAGDSPPLQESDGADHQFPDYNSSTSASQGERDSLLQAARKFAQARDWDSAAAAYSKLLKKAPNQFGAWKQYGHALKESGCFDLAVKAYYRALSLRPSDSDVTQHLGDLLIRTGKTEEARFILSEGNQLAPWNTDIARALSSLGGVLVENGTVHENKATSLGFFAKRRLQNVRGQAQQAARSHRWSEAAKLYQELSKLVPTETKYVIQMGHAYKEAGQYEEAEKAYRNVISKERLNSDAYLHLGHILKLQGRGAESRDAYQMSLRCWPYNRDTLDEI